jgi:glutamine amidotransferase
MLPGRSTATDGGRRAETAMCELLGLNSNVPTAVTFAFTGFSARGGGTGHHADGFGLAFHDDAGCRIFVDPAPAHDAELAAFLRRHPIRARTVLAHIRKATQGPVQLSNCHPFAREWHGRTWTFAHNGHLHDFHPRLRGPFRPVGSTDSERAFCWILQALRRRLGGRRLPGWVEVAPVLAELAAEVARHGRFNFLLSDGEALYAHCSTRLHLLQRRHPFGVAQLTDVDLSLDLDSVNAPGDRMALIATEPLTRNEPWQPLRPGELLVLQGGETVWRQCTAAAPSEPAAAALPQTALRWAA